MKAKGGIVEMAGRTRMCIDNNQEEGKHFLPFLQIKGI